jgi:hypothetical protein
MLTFYPEATVRIELTAYSFAGYSLTVWVSRQVTEEGQGVFVTSLTDHITTPCGSVCASHWIRTNTE